MNEESPRRANGEGFGDHRRDDDRSLTAITHRAQILALPRYPRRRVGVRQVAGGWQALILLADGRASPRFRPSVIFRNRDSAIAAARRAVEATGLPLDLGAAPDDDGPIAA